MSRIDYKKRKEQQTDIEIANNFPERSKRINRQGDIILVEAEFWDDKNDTLFNGAQFKMPKGDLPIKKWINKSGFVRCKMSEAISLLIVGEKKDGCFVIGKSKNYWLKPNQ